MSDQNDMGWVARVDSKVILEIFYGSVLVWLVFLLYWSRDWSQTDRLFPTIVGIPLLLLLVLQLINIHYPDRMREFVSSLVSRLPNRLIVGTSPSQAALADEEVSTKLERVAAEREEPKREQHIRAVAMIIWVVAVPFSVHYLGFATVVPSAIFLFGLYFLRDLKQTIVLTVIGTVAIHVLFVVILDTSLWEGVWNLPFEPPLLR